MHSDKLPYDPAMLAMPCTPEEAERRKRYWHSRTPQERLLAAQYLRRLEYGEAADGPMEHVIEITTWDPHRDSSG